MTGSDDANKQQKNEGDIPDDVTNITTTTSSDPNVEDLKDDNNTTFDEIDKKDDGETSIIVPDEGAGTKLPERQTWKNHREYLLTCLSMAMGLGNVWRFSVTAFDNGGGAFLIPYFVCWLCIGRPMYFLELCLGQFASATFVKVWACAPFFRGLGFAAMFASFSLTTYYCYILALPIYYIAISFQDPLPWAKCEESWAGKGACNGTLLAYPLSHNQSLSEVYYMNEVTKSYKDIRQMDHQIGPLDWKLSLCLLSAWVAFFLTNMAGVDSAGKAAYFFTSFPLVVLVIFLIRGVTLPGASEGLKYLFTPQWKKLYDSKVWYAAATQCFFSLDIARGSIIMMASYNKFHNDVYRDSLIISFGDTATCIAAGVINFSILGNLAHQLGKNVKDVVKGGLSMAFVSYTDAISKFPWCPQLFSVLFFGMLICLGVGSGAADAATIAAVICDEYPQYKRWIVTLVGAIPCFLLGLVYCTPSGQFLQKLVDFYGGGFIVYILAMVEIIAVSWVYGTYNFISDIEFMSGRKLGWFWVVSWGFIIPVVLIYLLFYSLITEGNLLYRDQPYPTSATVCGWLIALTAIVLIPIFGFLAVKDTKCEEDSSWINRFKQSLKPSKVWGPRDPEICKKWIEFKATHDRRSFLERIKDRWWNPPS